jgi:DNA gyrase subunit B
MLSSEEIRTLITALGTGIGTDDFDIAKLRYHKLIIMCDADVDGSHIRTLILTFFFRQMVAIIEHGYLYIAQPPLYKVAEGKKETYLKDDREYRAFLVERIQSSWELGLGTNGGRSLKGARLATFLVKMEEFRGHMERLASRGYPEDALRVALIHGLTDKKALADPVKLREVAEIIEASGFHKVEVGEDEEHGIGVIRFRSRRDGVEREVRLGWDLLTSVEYRAMAGNSQGLESLAAGRITLAQVSKDGKNGEPASFENLDDALDTLYAGAKKGLSIQRYKGLGEMNPGQLWETTMDPERRRLLQVRIEDAIAADQIFATLMGDQVEPRREFIEKNALDVRNLDV